MCRQHLKAHRPSTRCQVARARTPRPPGAEMERPARTRSAPIMGKLSTYGINETSAKENVSPAT